MSQVITTILLDDHPKGLRLLEMDNWPGKALVVPRAKLGELRERSDAQQAGLYFLFGEGAEIPIAYIGQSNNVHARVMRHHAVRDEEEWDTAVLFVGGLDGAYLEQLEHLAVTTATQSGRYRLINIQNTSHQLLTEAHLIAAQKYFERIKLVIGLAGFTVLEDPAVETQDSKLYTWETDGAKATGRLLESQEFIVYAGSTARKRETEAIPPSRRRKRQELIKQGILVSRDDTSYVFTSDHIFNRPSAAAGVIAGRASNGWTAWVDNEGRTLDENARQG